MKKNLSSKESMAVGLLISILTDHTEANPIKAKQLLVELNDQIHIPNFVTDSKLRGYCNYLRSNAILPVISGSQGYFVTKDPDIILKQIKSLINRADAIDNCAEGLKIFYKKFSS